jgi:hypothetical protein
MNAATLTLASKVLAKQAKAARADLPVGEHTINETVLIHVAGTVKCGEDYSQQIVLKADPFTLLAVALSHCNGVTIESIAREALTADPALVKSIKAEATAAWAKVKAPTETHCKGKVTVSKDAKVEVIVSKAEVA